MTVKAPDDGAWYLTGTSTVESGGTLIDVDAAAAPPTSRRIWPENGDGPLFRIDATTVDGCTPDADDRNIAGRRTDVPDVQLQASRKDGLGLVFPACALEVGDHDELPGVALGDFDRASDDRPVSRGAKPDRHPIQRAARICGASRRRNHVGTFIEGYERDARGASVLHGGGGHLPRTIENARRPHAERSVDRDDHDGSGRGRAGAVRPGERRGQQQQRDDSGQRAGAGPADAAASIAR